MDRLTQDLLNLEHVDKVSSPTNLKILSVGGIAPVQTTVLHYEDESLYRDDSIFIYTSPNLVGSYFPKDARSLSIFVKTEEGLSKSKSDTLAKRVERIINSYDFEKIHYVGRIFAQNVYLENLLREFTLFLFISFILVVIFLWISFKSLYGVIIPVIIVLVSILWTLGAMALTGKPIDIMSTMLPTMIFIAGMSDVVHFFSKYFDEVKKGTEKQKIFSLLIREVALPTFLTLLTTVVGFLSLLFSSIQPIRQFGIFTSVGVTIAFILTYTLLPAIMFYFPAKKTIQKHTIRQSFTGNTIRSLFLFVFRHQKSILVFSSIIILLSIFGISKIRVNNILLEDLSDKVKIKQDFNFFDTHYSGVRPLELLVTSKNKKSDIWEYQTLSQIAKVDSFIKKEYNAGFLISPASVVQDIYFNSVNEQRLNNDEDFDNIISTLRSNKKNKDLSRIITPAADKARITAKLTDMGSIKVNEHNQKLFEFIRTHTDTTLLSYRLTGGAHLVDRNNEYMVDNMTQGFVFSITLIGLLTYLLHRSWRMVIVFIIPNVVPLVLIAGLMGFAGIELKAATALVFSIALGIATDDTIHFISRLKIERSYGKSILYALKRTYFETGKPIVLTTFILVGGFMSLMISNFQSTFYFGFLICITIVIALIADLFLLPILLLLIYRKRKK